MPLCCPHCNTWLPEVEDATCPQCGGGLSDPPKNVAQVPDKMTVAGNSAEHVAVAIVLLLVIAGSVFAFVQALDEKDTALLVVFGLVILGCGAVLVVVVRQLIGWLRARSR
jgi:hypothetical protein